MANDNITGNEVTSSDFLKVLLALKDRTLKDCHVLELGIVKEINDDKVICNLLSNPSIKVQAIRINQMSLLIDQLVLIGFNDNDFKSNLNKYKVNDSLQENDSKERHLLTNGIIITNFQGGSSIKLYNSTGQNTDGAMTQKATADELNNKVSKTSVQGALYGTTTQGAETTLGYTSNKGSWSIVQRDSNNNFKSGTPTDNEHVANKQYVDTVAKALPIGSIIMGAMPLNDASVHLLDGSAISQTGIYADFVTLLKTTAQTYTQITCTQAQFDADVARTGNCGKFVIDNINNTIRLPKITRFVQGITSLTDIGTSLDAGLPNITGTMERYYGEPNLEGGIGAFSNSTSIGLYKNGFDTSWKTGGVTFDASRSNDIYGNSTTVQPEATQYPYYIILANGSKTDIEVDIDQVASDLNLKADKDLSNSSVPHIILTYENGTSGYRIWSDGYCEQWGKTVATGTITTISLFKSYESLVNYNVSVTQYWEQTGEWNANFHITSKTANSFNVRTSTTGSNNTVYWSTKGKLAVGQY